MSAEDSPQAAARKGVLAAEKAEEDEDMAHAREMSAMAAQDDSISGMHWVVGAAAATIGIAPTLILGVLETHEDDTYETKLWYKCWAPFILLCLVEIALASYLAPIIGLNMIKERSTGVSLKETMRTNLTTQGLISALFLTIVYAMLQADSPTLIDGDGDPSSLLSQWYLLLCTLALALTMIGTVATVLLLLYIEPLDDVASLNLVTWGMMYFGEPVAMSTIAFLDCMAATLLWIFGRYGFGAGIVCMVPVWYAACRAVVIFRYLSGWKNRGLTQEERNARKAWGSSAATVGKVKKPMRL